MKKREDNRKNRKEKGNDGKKNAPGSVYLLLICVVVDKENESVSH